MNRRSLFWEPGLDQLGNGGEPSCGAVETLERQETFVNQTPAYHGLALLAKFFRCG